MRPHASHGSHALIRLGFDDLEPGSAPFEERRAALLAAYRADIASATTLFAGMDAVIDRIVRRGALWGVVTNKPDWLTRPLLERVTLPATPACVVSGDTTPRAKPHPDPLFHACAALGVPPADCLYVGDAERDMIAARAARMPAVIALYGYLAPGDEPASWGADGSIDSPHELLQWL